MRDGTASGREARLSVPAARAGRAVVTGVLRLYRLVVSPWLGPACRFEPTCSCYAEAAVQRHGVVRGLGLAAHRLARCNPLGGSGYDPVP